MERKTVKFSVKQVDEEAGIIEGYGSTFSKVPDSYGDIVDEGAFTKTIKENSGNIVSLFNHSVNDPIGKPELSVDTKGLLARIKIVRGVRKADEVLLLAKAGVITQMSIGYNAIKESWEKGIRHLQEVKLYDVSPVIFAANPEAVILGVKQTEMKPYPHEHACRLRDPNDFEEGSFRRTTRTSDGKKYSIIMGRLDGEDTMTEQAYRYDREVWEEGEAKTHCDDHDGTFEAAKEDEFNCECIECGHKLKSKKHCNSIKCPKCGGKMRRAERPGPGKSEEDKSGRVLSATNLEKVKMAFDSLQALLDSLSEESEPEKSTHLSEAEKEAAELESIVTTLKAENEGIDTKQAEKRINAILEKLKSNTEVN